MPYDKSGKVHIGHITYDALGTARDYYGNILDYIPKSVSTGGGGQSSSNGGSIGPLILAGVIAYNWKAIVTFVATTAALTGATYATYKTSKWVLKKRGHKSFLGLKAAGITTSVAGVIVGGMHAYDFISKEIEKINWNSENNASVQEDNSLKENFEIIPQFYTLNSDSVLYDNKNIATNLTLSKGSCVSHSWAGDVSMTNRGKSAVWVKADGMKLVYVESGNLTPNFVEKSIPNCLSNATIIKTETLKSNETDLPSTTPESPALRDYFRVTASMLNIREGAGTNNGVEGKLARGSCVSVERGADDVRGFLEIMAQSANGTKIDGYVSAQYLSAIRPAPAACVATFR